MERFSNPEDPDSVRGDSMERREREPLFAGSFYVTDHSPDDLETGSPDRLRELYADIKRDGIDSVRYDWRWAKVEPQPGQWSTEHSDRYGSAVKIMQEVGLEAPTIVLSSVPKWALDLYKSQETREQFFESYKSYIEEVRDSLVRISGAKVSTFQILNEFNNKVYTPIALEDLPRLCEITRRVLGAYNPDVKLMATLLASNTGKFVGTPLERYLPEFKKIKDSFDIIALDYYPGMWHLPSRKGEGLLKVREAVGLLMNPERRAEYFKEAVKDAGFLKTCFEEVATWGKEYELGEVGMRTNQAGGEEAQRFFYDSFFRSFRHMLAEMKRKGLKLPSRVGLYQAMDQPPKNLLGKVLRKTTPFPEHDMGMRAGTGERKLILKGNRHIPDSEQQPQSSQFRKIINYLKSPAA